MGASDELVFLPLGGSGEIGMNLNLYGFGPESGRKWLMVDLGVTFGDESTPGVDLICPDPEYIEEFRDDILALLLTHAHEDHIGAVALLWPRFRCPIYATAFTAAMARRKFEEAGIEDAPIHVIGQGARLDFGPFAIEYVTLTHSIPEPNGIAIRTPLGAVLHTGDWKIDPSPTLGPETDIATIRKLGDDGLLAMVCDSTNVFSPGESGSELKVRENLIELVGELKGRVAVTTFASNVARVQSALMAASANGRHAVLVGRSMHRIVECAREAGVLKADANIVSADDAGYLPPDNVLYLCTGSQGEPRAALTRIANGDHHQLTLERGDTVIYSSRIIPGNERGIFAVQNILAEKGVRIITERDHFVHVSGHPCRDELRMMYEWARPQIAVPVHGEARHLAEHARYARELGAREAIAARNGEMIRLAPAPAKVIDEVPSGRLYLDGNYLTREGDGALRDRKRMAYGGHLVICIALDDSDNLAGAVEAKLVGAPMILTEDGDPLIRAIEEAVESAVESLPRRRRDEDSVREAARRAGRRLARDYWGKKPETSVIVMRV
ncbi:MAG: ribonuclease J [Parvularculaceae bacterium]